MMSILPTAFVALPLLLASTAAQGTSTGSGFKSITTLACYKNVDPLTSFGSNTYMTSGLCQQDCEGSAVMAITGGSTCWCGNTLPAANQIVDNSTCNSPCNGFGTQNCGGNGVWQVYLTGLTASVPTAPNTTDSNSASSSGSGTTSATPSVVTKGGATIVVTQSAAASGSSAASSKSSGGTSKVGIAVGVVVGLIAVAAIVGGTILYLKNRRRKAIEEEHKRNAAISSFTAGGKSEATSADQRLDPSIKYNRRESVGSIADEMDYSRRILQVRNPDFRNSAVSNYA